MAPVTQKRGPTASLRVLLGRRHMDRLDALAAERGISTQSLARDLLRAIAEQPDRAPDRGLS